MSKNCRTCSIEKCLEEFSGKSSKCKVCTAEYARSQYQKNGRANQRTKTSLKKGGKCDVCQREDHLEFDHVNPENKNVTIGRCQNSSVIVSEAKQCRLLCMWCHRIHSWEQRQKTKKCYDLKVLEDTILFNDDGIVCTGPICKWRKLDPSMFKPRKDGNVRKFYSHCNVCQSYTGNLKRKNARKIVDAKKHEIGKCQLCEKTVVAGTEMCFDFDHLNPLEKHDTISSLTTKGSTKTKIQKELAKCRLLCCFCHFDHTNETKVFHRKRGTLS